MKLPSKFTFTCTAFEDDEVYRVLVDGTFATVSWGSGIHEGSTTYPTKSVERFVEEGTWVIQEEEMKLPDSFKFTTGWGSFVYSAEVKGDTTTVSWDSKRGLEADSYEYKTDFVKGEVSNGNWEIQPETFDKADYFNFIEASMITTGTITFDKTAENPEGMWEDVKAFCMETNAVVTIFPEYFQIAIRGAVTRISTVEGLKELITAVRVLNKYKLA